MMKRALISKSLACEGFSLIETLLQLTILAVVTIPMVMMLGLQKQGIATSQQGTVNKVMADQLK